MKKLKQFLLRLPIYLLIVALIGVGVWQLLKNNQPPEILDDVLPSGDSQVPTGDTIVQSDDIKLMPQKVIGIGESYEYNPGKADGHLSVTITDARIVTEQSECPPRSWFGSTPVLSSSDHTHYFYDDWFIEGGAFDKNCCLIILDVTVTNVDMVGWPNNGLFDGECGFFNDPYEFHAPQVVQLANLSRVIYGISNSQYITTGASGFSRYAEYSKDVRGTIGNEADAIRLPIGETISYSIVFPVDASKLEKKDGTLRSFSIFMGCSSARADSEEDVFIDLKLDNGGV